jgi:hypothetical protein
MKRRNFKSRSQITIWDGKKIIPGKSTPAYALYKALDEEERPYGKYYYCSTYRSLISRFTPACLAVKCRFDEKRIDVENQHKINGCIKSNHTCPCLNRNKKEKINFNDRGDEFIFF